LFEKREDVGLKPEECFFNSFFSPRTEVRGNWNVGCLDVRRVKTLLNVRLILRGNRKTSGLLVGVRNPHASPLGYNLLEYGKLNPGAMERKTDESPVFRLEKVQMRWVGVIPSDGRCGAPP